MTIGNDFTHRLQVRILRVLLWARLIPQHLMVGVKVTPNGCTLTRGAAILNCHFDGQRDPAKPWIGVTYDASQSGNPW